MQSFSLFFVEITQEKLIEIINMTISYSGTVFTINGIWIAILFPEIFIKIYKENEQLKNKENFLSEAYMLLHPLFFGTIFLIISVIFRILIEIKLPYFSSCEWMLNLRFPIIVILVELISYSLFLALKPGIQTYINAREIVKKESRRARMFSNNPTKSKTKEIE
ncbi:Uncharacterised protein [Kingella kingae]|nr:Uncharacterised protein [Kingella kingae]